MVPVLWQRGHTGPEGLTVVHGSISSCNVAEELEVNDGIMCVSDGWSAHVCRPHRLKCCPSRKFVVCDASMFLGSCQVGDCFYSTENDKKDKDSA